MKNKQTRRQFLQASTLAGAGIALPWEAATRLIFTHAAAPPLDPRTLRKYVDLLPRPARLTGTYHNIDITEFQQVLHAQLPPTTVWGYNGSYPGPTIEAVRGVPTQVLWRNQLSNQTLLSRLPVDQTLHWADPLMQHPTPTPYTGPVPTVVHLHGGETEPQSDGHPDSWFTPNFALRGSGWKKEVYHYTNAQPATTLWYHDHVLGMTRLNVYAGMAGFYLLRDPQFEAQLNLPGGNYEREIVIQDRTFDMNGQLTYPNVGVNPAIHPFWMPEFFGDTIVVNGKIWPFLEVEPRKYRFRLLNGSNARFYNLKLSNGRPFMQIGTDGGYLARPVQVNQLLLAPGERADVIVDFSGHQAKSTITMTNDAKAPFPNGTPADPQTVGQIIQFRVVPLTAPDTSSLPASLSTIPTLSAPSLTRLLTLNEVMGEGGPLAVLLDGKEWSTPVTERPRPGATELWEIVNLTADAHPIHLHLAQFQLVNRQRFQSSYIRAYNKLNLMLPTPTTTNPPIGPYLQGGVFAPAPNERGWKDTVRMNPGEVTRILVRFAPIGGGNYPFNVKAAPGYVWHCHILEHEDNEMMRPYQLV